MEVKSQPPSQQQQQHPFFLQTKPWVTNVFTLLSANQLARLTKRDDHVFNGQAPTGEVNLVLVGESLSTRYSFNELFSCPFNQETIGYLIEATQPNWRNQIVINLEKRAFALVVAKFPELLRQLWNLPTEINIPLIPREKIKFDIEEPQPSDYFKVGIDPAGDNFITAINLKIPEREYLKAVSDDDLTKLEDCKIKLTCYQNCVRAKMHIDEKGQTRVEMLE